MIALKFVNNSAPRQDMRIEMQCDLLAVPRIMTWYGGYYSGDDYVVYANNVRIATNENGEPIHWETAAWPA